MSCHYLITFASQWFIIIVIWFLSQEHPAYIDFIFLFFCLFFLNFWTKLLGWGRIIRILMFFYFYIIWYDPGLLNQRYLFWWRFWFKFRYDWLWDWLCLKRVVFGPLRGECYYLPRLFLPLFWNFHIFVWSFVQVIKTLDPVFFHNMHVFRFLKHIDYLLWSLFELGSVYEPYVFVFDAIYHSRLFGIYPLNLYLPFPQLHFSLLDHTFRQKCVDFFQKGWIE